MVGDFDGDGQPDIAWSDGSDWYYSRGGRGPRTGLRSGAFLDQYAPLRSLLLGHFEGGRRTEAVSFERPFAGLGSWGNRLVIWRGAGSGNAFVTLSTHDMR